MKFSLSSLNPFKYFKQARSAHLPSVPSKPGKYNYTTKYYPELHITGMSTDEEGKQRYTYEPPSKKAPGVGAERIANTFLERSYSISRKDGKFSFKRKWSVVETKHPIASRAWSAVKRLFGVRSIHGNKALAIIDAAGRTYSRTPDFSKKYNISDAPQFEIDSLKERISSLKDAIDERTYKGENALNNIFTIAENKRIAKNMCTYLDQYV